MTGVQTCALPICFPVTIDGTEEAMDSMERKYWEGQLDALGHVYSLTYDLSFATMERERKQ